LYADDHVLSICRLIEDDGEEFQGSVYGSHYDLYETELYVDTEKMRVFSSCSCAFGYNCKHGVALAYALLDAAEIHSTAVSKSLTPDNWLQQFKDSLSPLPVVNTASQWHLFYLVHCVDGGFLLSVVQRYQKLSGDWGRMQSLSTAQAEMSHTLNYADREVLSLITGLPAKYMRRGSLVLDNCYEASGVRGRQLLEWALRSGRVLDAESLRYLRWGEPLALKLEWAQSNGGERLEVFLDPQPDADWSLFDALSPPLYRADFTIGPVDTHLNTHQLALIRQMPTISAEQKLDVSMQAMHHCNMPLLDNDELPDAELLDEGVPGMVFIGVPFPGKGILRALRFQVYYGDLCFELGYDEAIRNALNSTEPTLFKTDSGYVRLSRNWEKEAYWARSLRSESLVPYRGNNVSGEVMLPAEVQPQRHIYSWNRTLPVLKKLVESGEWLLDIDESYRHEQGVAHLLGDAADAGQGWFDLKLNLNIGSVALDRESVLTHWLEAETPDHLVLQGEDEYWQSVDMRPLKPVLSLLLEMFSDKNFSSKLRLPAFKAGELDELEDLNVSKAPALSKLRKELRHFKGVKTVDPARTLQAKLRDYQQKGLDWLMFLHRYGFGGILADDMGLGKTLQTLAFLQRLKAGRKLTHGALIVAPTSLIWNWEREASRFTPNLKVLILYGGERSQWFDELTAYDLVITTYGLIRRDFDRHEAYHYDVVVLDEAQNIKNARAKITRCVKRLPARMRLCLTGTPLENHLGELWSITDFVLPGLLGSSDQFSRQFRSSIERDGNTQQASLLSKRLSPFMLRRTKAEVVKELPAKIEMQQIVHLEGKQQALYESIRVSMEKRVRDLIKKKGLAKSRIEFLDALLKLRQSCIDPRLVKLDKAASIKQSAKMIWLTENVPEMVQEGRKILLFSQFTTMLDLVEQELSANDIACVKLTGRTRNRQAVIQSFQEGAIPIFLISLKAGGSGLNLTAADTVIHVDPWWNPAVENQATDRAHRIGQDKKVFVYKLVAAGTVEEKIQEMQASKQALAVEVYT